MAMVQVDLSEYDMLREAKDKAEKRVKELEEDIKGLKDKSRVILTTEYKYPTVNKKIVDDINRLVISLGDSAPYENDIRWGAAFHINVDSEIKNILSANIKFGSIPYNRIISHSNYFSSQYIGFDDVKARVEAYYKKDIDKAIADYKESEEDYNRLKDSIEERVRDEYSNVIAKLKKDNKLLIEKYEKSIEDITKSKDTEIKDLQDKVAELSKSKEEKVAELTAIIEDAQKRLEEIYGLKKKGLFKSIVEKWKK